MHSVLPGIVTENPETDGAENILLPVECNRLYTDTHKYFLTAVFMYRIPQWFHGMHR
jgi:hypothetical protein